MTKPYTTIPYSTAAYPFHRLVADVLGVGDLSLLRIPKQELFEVGHDSSTIYHKKFYAELRRMNDLDFVDQRDSPFYPLQALYFSFIWRVIKPHHPYLFLTQMHPTFRVHAPGNIAVGRWHRDREFGHPEGEINFIIPLTYSEGTASVWVESTEGAVSSMTLVPGELIEFDGNNLVHGNKVNETIFSRVSLDFRILPLSKYDKHKAEESATTKTKFTMGEYYMHSPI